MYSMYVILLFRGILKGNTLFVDHLFFHLNIFFLNFKMVLIMFATTSYDYELQNYFLNDFVQNFVNRNVNMLSNLTNNFHSKRPNSIFGHLFRIMTTFAYRNCSHIDIRYYFMPFMGNKWTIMTCIISFFVSKVPIIRKCNV